MRRIRLTAAAAIFLALVGVQGLALAATQTAPSAPAKGMLAVTYYYLPG